MKKISIVAAVMILALANVASGAKIAGLIWNESNSGKLHAIAGAGLAQVDGHAGIRPRPLPGRLLAQTSPAGGETVPDSSSSTDWVKYHDAATGLSFSYPASLRIHERDPKKFGLPDAEKIVDLVGDTKVNPNTEVLRFIVNRGETTAETAAARARTIRQLDSGEADPRESVTSMRIDGHEALVSVDCTLAACEWRVNILQPRECSIGTLLGGADLEEGLPPPHNGIFPLLSIIQTVHFDVQTKKKRAPG